MMAPTFSGEENCAGDIVPAFIHLHEPFHGFRLAVEGGEDPLHLRGGGSRSRTGK